MSNILLQRVSTDLDSEVNLHDRLKNQVETGDYNDEQAADLWQRRFEKNETSGEDEYDRQNTLLKALEKLL